MVVVVIVIGVCVEVGVGFACMRMRDLFIWKLDALCSVDCRRVMASRDCIFIMVNFV